MESFYQFLGRSRVVLLFSLKIIVLMLVLFGKESYAMNATIPIKWCKAPAYNCPLLPPYHGGTPPNWEDATKLQCERFGAAHTDGVCPCDGTVCSTVLTCELIEKVQSGFVGANWLSGKWSATYRNNYTGKKWSVNNKQGPKCGCPKNAGFTESGECQCKDEFFWDAQSKECVASCSNDQLADNTSGICKPPEPKNCTSANITTHPCQVSTGAKLRNETDISNGSLSFTRNYHSLNLVDKGLGKGWHNQYLKGLSVAGDSLSIVEGSGRGEAWAKVNGVWQGDADSNYLVAETAAGGLTVTDQRENVSEYDSEGRLLSETTSQNQTTSYLYDSENRLTQITNHYGLSLSFTYTTDGKNHIESVTDQSGVEYRYEYDANDNLVAVIYPDTTADASDNPRKTYHYENGDYPNHITGITDANGDRYATYAYDTDGKAILSELAKTTNSVGQAGMQLNY